MVRKSLICAVCLISAFIVASTSVSVTAFASEGDVTTQVIANGEGDKKEIEGSVIVVGTQAAVIAINGGEVKVEENVNYTDPSSMPYGAAIACDSTEEGAKGGTVNVAGDVTSNSDGVKANTGSVVGIGGDVDAKSVGVTAHDARISIGGDVNSDNYGVDVNGENGSVFVKGDVNGGKIGVLAHNDGVVTVIGDVSGEDTGVSVASDAKVTVGGNVDGGVLILEEGGAITVRGDVTGKESAIAIDLSDRKYDNEVLVEGTVKATDEDGYAITIVPPSDDAEDAELLLVLYKIEASDKDHVVQIGGDISEEDKIQAVEQVLENINYIIKVNDKDNAAEIEAETQVGTEYKTITRDGSATVTVKSGYYLEGSNAAVIKKNADGTYSVTLKEGCFGGLDLKILKKAIEEATGGEVTVEFDGNTEPEPKAGAIVVNAKDSTAPVLAPGAVAPSRCLQLKIAEITPSQMKKAVIDNISATPANGILRIECDNVSCFNKAMLQPFADRGDIDLEIIFTFNGTRYRVFVPRGTDINTLLDENGYCGFMRLAQIMGFQIIG